MWAWRSTTRRAAIPISRIAAVRECLPISGAVRRNRLKFCGAPHHRYRRRRHLSHCPGELRRHKLAQDQCASAGLCECNGRQSKDERRHTRVRLAATRGWAFGISASDGSGKLTGSLWLIGSKANCRTSATPIRIRQQAFSKLLHLRARAPVQVCWVICFGQQDAKGNGTGCTFPPTTCENGMGGAATAFSIPIPMPALRQN